jgi:hypothetical protein
VTAVLGVGSIGTPLTATEVGHPPVDGTRPWRAIALHGTYACRAPRWLLDAPCFSPAHRCALFFTIPRMLVIRVLLILMLYFNLVYVTAVFFLHFPSTL